MKKIVNKTRKGTAGSCFASAVNFFMTIDQCTIQYFHLLRENNHFCVKSLFQGKVRICLVGEGGWGDSHIKAKGMLVRK